MTGPWLITGIGLVSTAGDAAAAVFERVLDGPQPPDAADRARRSLPLHDFDPRRYLRRKGLQLLSRTSQLACAASSPLSAGLAGVDGARVGVVLGTAWASLDTVVRFEREAHLEGPRFVDPILFTETVANVPAGQMSIFNGWSAINATVASGTSSGLDALGRAIEFLDEGRAEAIVAGGADEINEHLLRTLADEHLAPSAAPAPAEPGRPGAPPVGSEGACLFTIETAAGAAARGAPGIGRIRGYVSGFADPGPAGTSVRAGWLCELAGQAGWGAGTIDLVVRSTNGRVLRDEAEASTLAAFFGGAVPPCVAPKSVLGECWSASGPLGVVVALEAMLRGIVPGCSGLGREEASWIREPPLERDVGRAVVLDCSETGSFSAVALSAGE